MSIAQESSDETMENTTTSHGIYSGRIKSNPLLGKFLIDVLEVFSKEFDGIPSDDMLTLIWGESRDALDKVIKRAHKRQTIEKAKFVPKGIIKAPTSALNLFAKKLKENGEKCTMKDRNIKWNKLADKEKAKYQKEYETARDAFKVAVDNQRVAAIKNGEFPEDRPKRGLTAYFHFLAEMRAKLTEKYKVTPEEAKNLSDTELKAKRKDANLSITKDAAELWKNLGETKKAKYVALQKKDQETFAAADAEWKKRDQERLRKHGNATTEDSIEIESSEVKPKATPKAAAATTTTTTTTTATEPIQIDSDAEVDEVVEVVEVVVPVKETPKKAAPVKKAAAAATATTTPAKEVAPATKKAVTKKPVAKAVSDDDADADE